LQRKGRGKGETGKGSGGALVGFTSYKRKIERNQRNTCKASTYQENKDLKRATLQSKKSELCPGRGLVQKRKMGLIHVSGDQMICQQHKFKIYEH